MSSNMIGYVNMFIGRILNCLWQYQFKYKIIPASIRSTTATPFICNEVTTVNIFEVVTPDGS